MEVALAKKKRFSAIQFLIAVAVTSIFAVVATPESRVSAHRAAVLRELNKVYVAFSLFYIDSDMFPNATRDPAFNLVSLNPLRGYGYYKGNVTSFLHQGRADWYDSPDDMGRNQEFWLQLTLDVDPSVSFLVARSDDAPLGGGQYLDGVYMFQDGVMIQP